MSVTVKDPEYSDKLDTVASDLGNMAEFLTNQFAAVVMSPSQ